MLYSGEQILSFKPCFFLFYAGDYLRFKKKKFQRPTCDELNGCR